MQPALFLPIASPSAITGIPTGLLALDAVLPGGGLPKGRLTEVVGLLGSGRTTLTRRLVAATVERGLRAAYVDAGRTLDPRGWAPLAEEEGSGKGVLVVRPKERAQGAWCADILLRSGAFALVVLDGALPLSRQVTVRLTRLAREAGAALVVVGDETGQGATGIPGALRLRTGLRRPGAPPPRGRREARWRIPGGDERGAASERPGRELTSVVVTVEKGGATQRVEVSGAIGWTRRLCTHSEVPDRRGVASGRAGRSGAADVAPGRTTSSPLLVTDRAGSTAGELARGWRESRELVPA